MKSTNDRLIRAARELLRWDQERLAAEAGVGSATVKRFESGISVDDASVAKMTAALEKAGVVFIPRFSIAGLDIVEGLALKASAKPERPRRRARAKAPAANPAPDGT